MRIMNIDLIKEKLRLIEGFANYCWEVNDSQASITIESDGSGSVEVVASYFRQCYDYNKEVGFEELTTEIFSELMKKIKGYE